MRKLLVAFLLLFSLVSFADSYPSFRIYQAVNVLKGGLFGSFSTGQDACNAAASTWPNIPAPLTFVAPWSCNHYDGWAMPVMTCPAGGILNYYQTSCINAPVCVAPQIRNATTGKCELPPTPKINPLKNTGKPPCGSSAVGWVECNETQRCLH